MERYAALLRSVNIGGKNKIPMAELKNVFAEMGFEDVVTCLNSGNVVFDSDEEITPELPEQGVKARFGMKIPIWLSKKKDLETYLDAAPEWWGTDDKRIYDNLIFVLPPMNAEEISEAVGEPTAGLEKISIGDGVIYHSFDRKNYGKCRWWKKTAEKGIAEYLTIRTAGTVRKIVKL